MLEKDIKALKEEIGDKVEKRLREFSSFGKKSKEEWFCELCFCLLTANSKASTAIAIQKELRPEGFLYCSKEHITSCIRRNNHRFHNNKAKFIVDARKFSDVRDILREIKGSQAKRDWLVENIKGLGYKEASHFLRNTGQFDLAILDRHVLNILLEKGYLREKPRSLDRKRYLEIEAILAKIAANLKMSQAELDMYLWYMKAGEVLK